MHFKIPYQDKNLSGHFWNIKSYDHFHVCINTSHLISSHIFIYFNPRFDNIYKWNTWNVINSTWGMPGLDCQSTQVGLSSGGISFRFKRIHTSSAIVMFFYCIEPFITVWSMQGSIFLPIRPPWGGGIEKNILQLGEGKKLSDVHFTIYHDICDWISRTFHDFPLWFCLILSFSRILFVKPTFLGP